MKITVTQQDIDRGVRGSPYCCPIAYADGLPVYDLGACHTIPDARIRDRIY